MSRYYAMVVVVTDAGDAEDAHTNIAGVLALDEVQFVGEAWEVAPIVRPAGTNLARDGAIYEFDTLRAIEQHPGVATVIPMF